MSYDIRLKDPVTGETCEVPAHLLTGGTYAAEYHEEDGTFTPKPITEAWLNITYNYSHYFREAMKAVCEKEDGIYEFHGKEAVVCIPIISEMIEYIKLTYSDPVDGDENKRNWKTRIDKKPVYYDEFGNEKDANDYFYGIFTNRDIDKWTKKEIEVEVNEGDTIDYWESTAANALSALYKLKALMQLRPDGIVEVS